MSWCSLSDSKWELNSLTRSLCVLFANLLTRLASYTKQSFQQRSPFKTKDTYPLLLHLFKSSFCLCFARTAPDYCWRVPATARGRTRIVFFWTKRSLTDSRSLNRSASVFSVLDFFFFLRTACYLLLDNKKILLTFLRYRHL